MRKTKIICTLGPSTDKGDVLRDLIANGMNIKLTDAAYDKIVAEGTDLTNGARPLRRAVTSEVEDLVAEESLEGRISKGSEVVLDVENDKLVLKTKDAETKAE